MGNHSPVDGHENAKSEFERFDVTIRKVISISRDELKQREQRWAQERAKKKPATSPASEVSRIKR